MVTHSALVPFRSVTARSGVRMGATSRHYPAARSVHTVDPYVTFAPLYTGRFAGRRYPRMGAVQWKGGGGWAGPRLGQDGFFTDLYNATVNAVENVAGGLPINAPNAGGGSVTVGGQTTYVNASGDDQSTLDPLAGQTPGDQLQQAVSTPTGMLIGLGLAAAVAVLLYVNR